MDTPDGAILPLLDILGHDHRLVQICRSHKLKVCDRIHNYPILPNFQFGTPFWILISDAGGPNDDHGRNLYGCCNVFPAQERAVE